MFCLKKPDFWSAFSWTNSQFVCSQSLKDIFRMLYGGLLFPFPSLPPPPYCRLFRPTYLLTLANLLLWLPFDLGGQGMVEA